MRICAISNAHAANPYGSYIRPTYIVDELSRLGNEIVHFNAELAPSYRGNVYVKPKRPTNSSRLITKLVEAFHLASEIRKFKPEVIYPHELNNGVFALVYSKLSGTPVVFDPECSETMERSAMGLDYPVGGLGVHSLRHVAQLEETVLQGVSHVIAYSQELLGYLISNFGISRRKITVVPNGVDLQRFRPFKPRPDVLAKLHVKARDKVLMFTCPRNWPSNTIALRYFLNEIVPKLESRLSKVRVVVLGGGDRLDSQSSNVMYTGFVRDLPGFINAADVCVSPYPTNALCGGVRNKVLEYFACGKPLVSTNEGMRGMDQARPGVHYLLARDEEEFVDCVCRLLENQQLGYELGRNARMLVEREFDWNFIGKTVETVLRRVVG